MKKNISRALIVAAIALVLYNLIVFLVPFDRENAVFWISYGFTLVAYIVTCVSVYMGALKSEDAKSGFYTFPTVRIGLNYGVVQLIVGLVAMAVGPLLEELWWLPTLAYAIGLGVVIVMLLIAAGTVDQIKNMDGQLKARTYQIRALQSKVNPLVGQCADDAAVKAVSNLAEELRYSDPVSSPKVAEAEQELTAVVDALVDAVADGEAAVIVNLCGKATILLKERNRLCKLYK